MKRKGTLNQPRIRPDPRRRQLRVSLACPRCSVLRPRDGDFGHEHWLRIGSRQRARFEQLFAVALPCPLNNRLLWLLRHVRPHTTQNLARKDTMTISRTGKIGRTLRRREVSETGTYHGP